MSILSHVLFTTTYFQESNNLKLGKKHGIFLFKKIDNKPKQRPPEIAFADVPAGADFKNNISAVKHSDSLAIFTAENQFSVSFSLSGATSVGFHLNLV